MSRHIGGFDATATAIFTWLGVVTYFLAKPEIISEFFGSIWEILEAEVVFDYLEPVENHLPEQKGSCRGLARNGSGVR